MSRATDLIRVAELIWLAADTARSLVSDHADGQLPVVIEAAHRIDAAADDLIRAGHALENGVA